MPAGAAMAAGEEPVLENKATEMINAATNEMDRRTVNLLILLPNDLGCVAKRTYHDVTSSWHVRRAKTISMGTRLLYVKLPACKEPALNRSKAGETARLRSECSEEYLANDLCHLEPNGAAYLGLLVVTLNRSPRAERRGSEESGAGTLPCCFVPGNRGTMAVEPSSGSNAMPCAAYLFCLTLYLTRGKLN